ncbi:AAA-ATPase ASD, mitochondrial [Glycine max]|nr:AAA-ATPase ASD, mitochondrial [Glycine max]
MYEQFFPHHLRTYVKKYTQKLTYPYIQVSFPEFSGGENPKESEAYTVIQTYLSANSSQKAKRIKAEVVKDSQTPLVFSMDDNEKITVKKNTKLRRLLVETSSKSIVVIEDIDCSLDLTGQRKNEEDEDMDTDEEEHNNSVKKCGEEGRRKLSKMTLSALLNFTDGIWSALIRRGRIDKHTEMSFVEDYDV